MKIWNAGLCVWLRTIPGLGFKKLEGELRKLGFEVSRSTVRRVLRRHGIPPAPERSQGSLSWRTFLNHYKEQILACDFFTIETAWLKTLNVLFFIEPAVAASIWPVAHLTRMSGGLSNKPVR